VVVLVPFYILMVHLRLLDTWLGLILAYSTFNLAFCVVIMRDIFRDVSKEVEEAARIEGANLWQIFWMIALPLSLDGLIVTAVIVFSRGLSFGAVKGILATNIDRQSGDTGGPTIEE
jgi:multiple sugar transport system permease protein